MHNITVLDNLDYDILDFSAKSKETFKDISKTYPELPKYFMLRLYDPVNGYHNIPVISLPDFFFYYNTNDYSYTLISKKEEYKTYVFSNKFFDIFSMSFDSGEGFNWNVDKNAIDTQTFFYQKLFC